MAGVNRGFTMSDQSIIEVFRHMVQTHACSVDAILTTPELRETYLAEARAVLGHLPEHELLHKLVSLRKRSKLPRSRERISIVPGNGSTAKGLPSG
jgi:hypothetical protein